MPGSNQESTLKKTYGNFVPIPFHLTKAKNNGLTETELKEGMTIWRSTLAGQGPCPPSPLPSESSRTNREMVRHSRR